MKNLAIVTTLLGLAVAYPACAEKIKPGQDGYFDGYILKGEKFGIKIGMDRSQARALLTRQRDVEYVDTGPCTDLVYFVCPQGDEVDGYLSHKALRDGVINVLVDHGKVVGIQWDLTLFGTFDP
ncbi:MAG TPA: hypothetical protein VG839_04440 [Asticcacaulis sp.]|nr:hypothetical protein [Asticcacaulis sp.]